MAKISVVISVFNAQDSLGRTLRSLSWASEVIVVDNQSTDQTAAIAKKFGAKILVRKNNPMLNVNKNFGFEKVKNEWILSLDSDEEIPSALAQEMEQATGDTTVSGYWIPRKNIIFGRWIRHGLWWPDKQLRLFRKGSGKFPCKHVHEYLEVDGPTGELLVPYIHYNYTSVSQFIHKMDSLYTESEVEKHVQSGYQISWMDALRFPVSDFVKVYFAQKGYRDGLHGLVLAILQSFYSFVVFAKLWERAKFVDIEIKLPIVTRELGDRGREISYWSKTAEIESEKNPILREYKRIIRKLYAP